MRFRSVHGGSPPVSFREALVDGLAPDGGLYVPEALPRLSAGFLDGLGRRTLHEIGLAMLSPFIDEIPRDDLGGLIREAWDFPIPLTRLADETYLLELFHGETLAFKDVGARFMARTLGWFLGHDERELTILVATSGDTGSAVARGFHRVPRISVLVLYPSGRISRLQEQQITTVGDNVTALEIDGTFDDCQRMVKQALTDDRVRAVRALSTANSINLGRLLPQTAYYGWAAAQYEGFAGKGAAPPVVVVPSGNFGNLTAAEYARRMGVPLGTAFAATNRNDVVPEFFRTGTYRPRASVATLSNAMDVGRPSNLDRLLALEGGDVGRLASRNPAGSVTDEETLEEIRRTFEITGRVLDPHTAVGVRFARTHAAGPVIVAATAHPAKFSETVERSIGRAPDLPAALETALAGTKRSIPLPADYPAFRAFLMETR